MRSRRAAVTLVCTALAAPAAASAQTVAQVAARGECSTAGVVGISAQLVETQLCMFPGVFVRATPHANVTLTATRVQPLMLASARAALWAASGSINLQVNSMFRTLADQYVLYNSGGCGLAATPGNSNHETGTAVDLQNWSAAQRAMTSAGCRHPYPGTDDVHFDCPGADRRADSVRAFQHLWNVNNPGDTIDEDGAYGPMTGARMGRSPSGGFARGGCAPTTPAYDATLVTVSCPATARSGDRPTAYVEYRNTGTATWNAPGTRLGTTGPRDRRGVFFDATNWLSANRPSAVDRATAPGAVGRFSFVLNIPTVTAPQTLTDTYALVQEGTAWFGPADDAVRCAVRVSPAAVTDAGVDVPATRDAVADVGDATSRDVTSDAPEVFADASDDADDAAGEDAFTDDVADAGDDAVVDDTDGGLDEMPAGGCQCDTARPAGASRSALVWALLGAAVLRRRRRRA